MRRKKMSFTTRYVLAFGLLMLAANIILGAAILFHTQATLKDLINTNMLDVLRTAAELEDGDALAGAHRIGEDDADAGVLSERRGVEGEFEEGHGAGAEVGGITKDTKSERRERTRAGAWSRRRGPRGG